MEMDKGQLVIAVLIIIPVLLCCETTEIEERSDTCVKVEVNLHYGQNSSETACEAPKKPSNGGYVSESDVDGHKYNTGDTIQYYCHRGHRLIGQSFRTCNGTTKQWEPDEPYCEPEYIGDVMRRLNTFEDKLNAMEQRLTLVENNTLKTGDKISAIDKEVLATLTESFNSPISKLKEHLVGCLHDNKVIDQNTVLKCVTLQLGVRDGYSVFESKWVIKDFKSKVPQSGSVTYYSPPFYHTVPGYKFRLRGDISTNSDFNIYLLLHPGEYDDQLIWPTSIRYDLTVLTNDGSEVLHGSQLWSCSEKQPTSATRTSCYTRSSVWDDVNWPKKKYILNDGSVAFKLYLYTII